MSELHVDVCGKLLKLLYSRASSARRVQEQCFAEARDIAIANDASFFMLNDRIKALVGRAGDLEA